MDLLKQLRQSPSTVAAAAAVAPAASGGASRHPAAPPAITCDVIAPPVEWTLDASAGWAAGMPVVQFHEGDWEPSAAGPPSVLLPTAPPLHCTSCGFPFAWQDLGDPLGANLHCCECVEIPSRRLLLRLWQVVTGPIEAGWPNGRPRWAPWEPRHWNPFAEIEAEEEKAMAARAAVENEAF